MSRHKYVHFKTKECCKLKHERKWLIGRVGCIVDKEEGAEWRDSGETAPVGTVFTLNVTTQVYPFIIYCLITPSLPLENLSGHLQHPLGLLPNNPLSPRNPPKAYIKSPILSKVVKVKIVIQGTTWERDGNQPKHQVCGRRGRSCW